MEYLWLHVRGKLYADKEPATTKLSLMIVVSHGLSSDWDNIIKDTEHKTQSSRLQVLLLQPAVFNALILKEVVLKEQSSEMRHARHNSGKADDNTEDNVILLIADLLQHS